MQKVFGTKNDREVKKYFKRVAYINSLESKYQAMSDDELKAKFNEFKAQVQNGEKSQDELLDDVFAIVREVGKRTLNMRHFDVQLIGGMVLNDGKIAEMKTGEGKTLVASLPVVLNAMSGKGVHVVTVNDYLAKRDATQMGEIYKFLGLSVGVILGGEYDDAARKAAYDSDITYGTNNEFGFDYLRDNMKMDFKDKVQREHNFVIVDEVDSILIDEARTPLIISGPTNRTLDGYIKANEVARQMKRGEPPATPQEKATGDFTVDEKNRTIAITEEGISKAEKLFGVANLYDMENAILSHHLDQALKAHNLFEKDVHYVVREGQVVIVDEFTGRLSEGRRFSEGLHQALEAKEGVKIQEESQTLADITFQNYFRLYKKLSGMTGTAQTEATEFSQIYKLDVVSIPTNVPVIRKDNNDLIYKTENEKFKAVIDEIKKAHDRGQPVLVGTASIEKSEKLHNLLVKEKIPHSVLNAKNHEKEAEIIAQAGARGAVTIATNMAGRGVDIRIDDEVRNLGGLYIIGTERHRSRRMCDHRERNIEMIVRVRTPCHAELAAQLSDPYRSAHRPKVTVRKRYVYRLELYRMAKLSPVRRNHIRCSRHACCTAEFGKDFSSRITLFRTARIFAVRQNTVHIFAQFYRFGKRPSSVRVERHASIGKRFFHRFDNFDFFAAGKNTAFQLKIFKTVFVLCSLRKSYERIGVHGFVTAESVPFARRIVFKSIRQIRFFCVSDKKEIAERQNLCTLYAVAEQVGGRNFEKLPE